MSKQQSLDTIQRQKEKLRVPVESTHYRDKEDLISAQFIKNGEANG